MRVTKAEVIKTASDMADRNGLHNVSLKAIAENLGIRTPSLYNHIGSLDELLREIAHSGMRTKFTYGSNMRGSAEYRHHLGRVLLRRCMEEIQKKEEQ